LTGYLIDRTDSIPYGGRSGTLEAELHEIERALADTMHQPDARNRVRGAPEPFEEASRLFWI
jgi:hypothetical protein